MTHSVYKFTMFFDNEFPPEDRQERYVVAATEDDAIDKFHQYLDQLKEKGFAVPTHYSDYPTVELEYVIV